MRSSYYMALKKDKINNYEILSPHKWDSYSVSELLSHSYLLQVNAYSNSLHIFILDYLPYIMVM